MSVTEKLHFIELKVMRLTLPTFNSNMFFCGETRDYGTDILKKDLLNEFICSEYDVPSSVGVMLKLPQTFGTIYLGETFKAYVTVHNLQSDQKVFQIILNIYIQTGTQKINIYNPDIIKEIDVNNNYDQIIQHEVKELGSHVLVCEVTYSANEGQTMHFRKFFKFQVNKPLDVKTKFYNSETGKVFLETQVQNLTNHPLVLEQMALFPHSNYIVKDANYDNNNEFIFNKINCLNPMDVRQYLFCLYIKKKPIQNKETLTLTDVGKLHISWRGPYGEKGALQTSQLHRLPSQIPDILLQVETIPDQIEMEKSFALNCRITNFTERVMDLDMRLIDDMNTKQNIFWLGMTKKHLGKLEPGQHSLLPLTVYATHPGFKSISGIRLLDTFLNRTYEYDNIGQVYVMDPIISIPA